MSSPKQHSSTQGSVSSLLQKSGRAVRQTRLSSIGRSPVKLASILAILLLIWLVVIGDHKRAHTEAPKDNKIATNTVSSVQILRSQAEAWSPSIVTQGQLLPWRRVTLNAEVEGRVLSLEKNQGEPINAGDTLLTLSDEGRSAELEQAKASVAYAELELKSAEALKGDNFVSATEISQLKSALAAAKAQLEKAQLAFEYGKARAPFSGIVDRRHIEQGDFVNKDAPLFDIVQIDRLRVSAYIPQQKVMHLQSGQNVKLTLLNGQQMDGELGFISAAADEATRSYYIEVSVDNPQHLRIAGASVTLQVPVAPVMSHSVSPALLSLNKDGKPGLYTVNDNNIVEYHTVELLSVGTQAVVTGLPDDVRIISVGAGFVKEGQSVETREPAI